VLPVIDGHNDALSRLHRRDAGVADFLEGNGGAVTLRSAAQGGLAAGLFAILAPPGPLEVVVTDHGYDVPLSPPVPHEQAAQIVGAMGARLVRLLAAASGRLVLVRDASDLDRCLAGEGLGVVLHMEGAEAIDADLEALERWYAAGLRSLGPVWSRPNAFGCGVPFRFPASPDVGPGLTRAGRRLVRRCAELGIAVDVSHLNAAGFADVARVLDAPLIASHSGVHALCPSTRNLTDDQLDAIAATDGLVAITFEVSSVRADGHDDPDTPLARIVEHVRYVAERVGVEHVALGSDFDGATMPRSLAGPAALPLLVDELAAAGFTDAELRQIAHGNWRRVLALAWR
jgi:membrane dipeptidase